MIDIQVVSKPKKVDVHVLTIENKTSVPVLETKVYDGDYEITPQAHNKQVLLCKNKKMTENITVLEVPYFETSNENGITVYIANEV